MNPDVGEILAQARRARGLTHKDVEAALKIRAKYIAALEAGDTGGIQGEAYVVGFLRSYARFLELDPDELATRYRESLGQRFSRLNGSESSRKPPARQSRRGRLVLVTTLALLFILAGAYFGLRGASRASSRPKQAKKPAAKPAVDKSLKRPGKEVAERKIRVQLETRAENGAWVRVTADGQVVFEEILSPGEKREWTGKDSVIVRTGKPSLVFVTVDGRYLGPIDSQPGVAEKEFKVQR